jgi:hypothetical protein
MKFPQFYQVLGVLALAAVLAAAPARAEMYLDAYLGGNFAGSTSDSISGHWADTTGSGPFTLRD